jgi:hypothetical protein
MGDFICLLRRMRFILDHITGNLSMMIKKSLSSRGPKIIGGIAAGLIVLYLILLIPEKDYRVPVETITRPFVWDRDELWASLEKVFVKARTADRETLSRSIDSGFATARNTLAIIEQSDFPPQAEVYNVLETALFGLAAQIAASPARMPEFIELFSTMRHDLKYQSRQWDMDVSDSRRRIYGLLYGGWAAIDEIMLQASSGSIPPLVSGFDEPSNTPSARLLGMTIHSGDILVSRGGAPTSALIARGNDYPGNFSHVALVYVDNETGDVSIIESHIECGAALADIDKYMKDTKLRIMALRLQAELPALVADSMLPHKVATAMLARVKGGHMPYDFAMDFHDDGKLFCSEVVSAAYSDMGISLWMGLSHISSLRLRIWLAALGVRHFETQEPSDLEYDPQLTVVAEWRNPQLLYQDHLDNAVLDAMLERGDSTATLDYNLWLLPVVRLVKAYSRVLNWFGAVGPIPEGMSATAALRVQYFSQAFEAIKTDLINRAQIFKEERGYRPPYWALVGLATEAKFAYASKDSVDNITE